MNKICKGLAQIWGIKLKNSTKLARLIDELKNLYLC